MCLQSYSGMHHGHNNSKSVFERMWEGDYEDIENVDDIDEIDLSNFLEGKTNVKHEAKLSPTKDADMGVKQETGTVTLQTVEEDTNMKHETEPETLPIVKGETEIKQETKNDTILGWSSSLSLPRGWKYQKQQDQVMFLSDEGTFLTQRDVSRLFRFIGQTNKKEDLSEWTKNLFLPDGWLCKEKKNQEKGIILREEQGTKFYTFKAAAAFMNQNQKYNQYDLSQLYLYPDGKIKSKSYRPKDWKTNKDNSEDNQNIFKSQENRDNHGWKKISSRKSNKSKSKVWKTSEYLPEGWLCKDRKEGKKGIIVKDKDGNKFKSYRIAAAFMKNNKEYDENSLKQLYLYPNGTYHSKQKSTRYKTKGWKTSEYLPEGWLCKDRKKGKKILVKADDGTKLKSYRMAEAYMKINKYNENSLKQLYLYPNGVHCSKQKGTKDIRKGWKASEYLPEGWQCKDRKEGRTEILIRAEDETSFCSYKSAATYMETNKAYNEYHIKQLYLYPNGVQAEPKTKRNKLHSDRKSRKTNNNIGWIQSEYLPEGWLCKDPSSSIKFQARNGTRFTTYTSAVQFMKLDKTYTSNDIEKLYLYPDGKKTHKTNTKEWLTNAYLPNGWKCKDKREGATNIMLRSDEGTTLTSYRAAAAFMEQNAAYTKEDIKQLYLYPDGLNHQFTFIAQPVWKTNDYLPEGWSYSSNCDGRSGQKDRRIIKSDIGFKFKSLKAAADYMKNDGSYTVEQINRLFLYPDGIGYRRKKRR